MIQIIQQLQIAESTIESLQSQIDELQKSENLIRARENHAAMLTSLKEKHNEEVYKFKVEIDELKETLSLKVTFSPVFILCCLQVLICV